MASVYEAGWRQGSIVIATLPFDAVVLDPSGPGDQEKRQISSYFRVPPLGLEPRTFGLKVRCSAS